MKTFQSLEPEKLEVVAKDILQIISGVMPHYKGAALVAIFDTIATLAEVLQERIRTQEIAGFLMPLLI